MDQFRVGRISSINPKTGMARVTYEDRDDTVTDELPMLSFGFIFWMPRVGDPVLVLHMDNGSESGVILGRYYCAENVPPEGKSEFFRQEFERGGESFLRHSEGQVTELYVKPAGLLVTATDGGVEIDAKNGGYKLIATEGGVQIDAKNGGMKIDATSGGLNIEATQGGVTINAMGGGVKIIGTLTVTNGLLVTGAPAGGGGSAVITGSIQQIDGDYTTTGNIHSDGDTTAGSVSLKNHTHGGVQAGGSNTSTPN